MRFFRFHRSLRRLAAGLAVAALVLQVFVPISAVAAVARGAGDDVVALCTQNGIVWVSLADGRTVAQAPAADHRPDCPLCPACSYCPVTGGLALLSGAPDSPRSAVPYTAFRFSAEDNGIAFKAVIGTSRPRAPPVFS